MHIKNYSIVLTMVCLIISGITASCQSGITDRGTTAATETAIPTPDEAASQAAISQALMALYNQPNRMEATTLPESGEVQTSVIEFVPPDRKHISSPGDGVEYVIVDKVVYTRTPPSGVWEESDIPASAFMGAQEVTQSMIAKTVNNAQFVRRDVLDGKPMLVYSFESITKSGGIPLQSKTELWVGEADGLPYQMINDGQILSASTDPVSGADIMIPVQAKTTTLITFDDAISIEPPVMP